MLAEGTLRKITVTGVSSILREDQLSKSACHVLRNRPLSAPITILRAFGHRRKTSLSESRFKYP